MVTEANVEPRLLQPRDGRRGFSEGFLVFLPREQPQLLNPFQQGTRNKDQKTHGQAYFTHQNSCIHDFPLSERKIWFMRSEQNPHHVARNPSSALITHGNHFKINFGKPLDRKRSPKRDDHIFPVIDFT